MLLLVVFCCLEFTLNTVGVPSSLYTSGHLAYGLAVLVVNLHLLNSMPSHHPFGLFLLLGSAVIYWAWLYLENLFTYFKEVFGIFNYIMNHPITYLLILFVIGFVCIGDLVLKEGWKWFRERMELEQRLKIQS